VSVKGLEGSQRAAKRQQKGLPKGKWQSRPYDPAAVAIVAALVDPEGCRTQSGKIPASVASRANRRAIMRALVLIDEAQDLVINGPSPQDIPPERQEQWNREYLRSFEASWLSTDRVKTPGQRLVARTKLVTGLSKAKQAKDTFTEFLPDYCSEHYGEGKLTAKVPTKGDEPIEGPHTPKEYVALLESRAASFDIGFELHLNYLWWNRQRKRLSASRSRAGKKKGENNF
jgi:hypothetical protein